MTADYARAVREHVIDLAFIGDRLVGLIEMIPLADHLLIENVAVLPGLQGGGIGRRLMRHAESVAAQRGLDEIRLYANKLFAANLGFYERLGYAIDREEPFMGGAVVHMRKAIDGAES